MTANQDYVITIGLLVLSLISGMLGLGLASAKRGIFPGMDLVDPEVGYVGLARSLGVRAERVEKPGSRSLMKNAFSAKRATSRMSGIL